MDKCKHGFDHACLICGFTHIDGKKVWFDWAWQEQQKRIDELQKQLIDQGQRFNENTQKIADAEYKNRQLQSRMDAASKETQHALRYVEEDMRGNHEFLKMAMIRTFKSLAQALKGGEV